MHGGAGPGGPQLPARRLALEVTESVCLDSLETVAETLVELQALGVETQIDDFGTGYSSLSYLQRLPVRSIKIDRSFIRDINDGSSNDPQTSSAPSSRWSTTWGSRRSRKGSRTRRS